MASIVSQSFRENFILPVGGLLDGEQANVRASLFLFLVLGSSILRFLLRGASLEREDARGRPTG